MTCIVIADCDQNVREQLRSIVLRSWPSAAIIGETSDHLTALRISATRLPDVVFLDAEMPGMDIANTLRLLASCALVVLMVKHDAEQLTRLQETGLAILTKPLFAADVTQFIKQLRDGGLRLEERRIDFQSLQF